MTRFIASEALLPLTRFIAWPAGFTAIIAWPVGFTAIIALEALLPLTLPHRIA